MKSPCPECAASSVWVDMVEVSRRRGMLTLRYLCRTCGHTWTDQSKTARPIAAQLRTRKPSQRKRR